MRFQPPPALVGDLALALLFCRRRSFHAYAQRLVAAVTPPMRVEGVDNIPDAPGVITVNHYSAPGFSSIFIAAGISAVVPREVTWAITGAWTYPGERLGLLKERASRWLLGGIARVFDFISMPPMPPRPGEEAVRAAAVRQILARARRSPAPLLGMAPEGRDTPGGGLAEPPPGVGRMLLELARLGLPFYPVGIYIKLHVYTLRFGAPYRLEIPSGLTNTAADRAASQAVMAQIAKCII